MQGWLSLKGISFHSICSRRYSSYGASTRSAPWRCSAWGRALHSSQGPNLLLLEHDLVEEELQVLVGVVDAELLEAVELGEESQWRVNGESKGSTEDPTGSIENLMGSTVSTQWPMASTEDPMGSMGSNQHPVESTGCPVGSMRSTEDPGGSTQHSRGCGLTSNISKPAMSRTPMKYCRGCLVSSELLILTTIQLNIFS